MVERWAAAVEIRPGINDARRGLPDFERIADACPVLLAVVDDRPEIVWVNTALRALTRPWGEVTGRLAWDLLPDEIGLAATTCPADPPARFPEVPEEIWTDAHGHSRWISWSLTVIEAGPSGHPGRRWLLATGVDVTLERRHQATWRERAHTDALTGLANRAGACAALEECLDRRGGRGCAVVVGDLDDLKRINDRFGHAAGDAVLQGAAQRLGSLVRPEDVVARLGGDEFVVIMPDAGIRAGRAFLATVEAAFDVPMFLDVGELSVGVSLGLRLARPGDDPARVLHDADLAMYATKQRRKSSR